MVFRNSWYRIGGENSPLFLKCASIVRRRRVTFPVDKPVENLSSGLCCSGAHGWKRCKWLRYGYNNPNLTWKLSLRRMRKAEKSIWLPCAPAGFSSQNQSPKLSTNATSQITRLSAIGSTVESGFGPAFRIYNRATRMQLLSRSQLVAQMWSGIIQRSKLRNHALGITKDELFDFVLKTNSKKFEMLYLGWVAMDFHKWFKPSIDRLDSRKGYSLENIRLVTWRENFIARYREGLPQRRRNSKRTHNLEVCP